LVRTLSSTARTLRLIAPSAGTSSDLPLWTPATGWLIFALPPAELAVHPAEELERHELFFMCDDLKAEIVALAEKGVRVTDLQEARWGSIAKIRLPGGGELGLYEPKHPTALALTSH
jgi:hypothetical protein